MGGSIHCFEGKKSFLIMAVDVGLKTVKTDVLDLAFEDAEH